MENNVKVAAHVETKPEADMAVAALADEGINAVIEPKNAGSVPSMLAMPGAMGFSATEGYDILVNAADEEKAAEILIGIGAREDAADTQKPKQEEQPAEQGEEKPVEEPTDPGKPSVLLMILFLAAAGLFVIGVDKLIELIKTLLS